ncbi:MAG: hypothetical protein EOM61_10610, partial [Bacteroidia bacterium]|nr:hypothetical protein [Bacteroidia bacterium]
MITTRSLFVIFTLFFLSICSFAEAGANEPKQVTVQVTLHVSSQAALPITSQVASPANSSEEVRFAYLTDVHISVGTTNVDDLENSVKDINALDDIDFVIHFQRPGSVVAYYQQVGRAGRAVDKSYGILLNGSEDDEIQNYFIDSAFPSLNVFQDILRVLEASEGMSFFEILSNVNTSTSKAEKAIKLLEVDGAIAQAYDKKVIYFRTPNKWTPNTERVNRVLELRRSELSQMQSYVDSSGCLMQFLLDALDDPD